MKKKYILGIPFLHGEAGCRNMGEGPTHFWDAPFHCIVCGDLTSTGRMDWENRRGIIKGKQMITAQIEKAVKKGLI